MFGISSFAEAPFASLAGQNNLIALTGVQADGAVGTVVFTKATDITGVSADGAVGSVSASISVALTGVTAAGEVGTVVYTLPVEIFGAAGSGFVGSVTVEGSPVLSGVSASGSLGTLGVLHENAIVPGGGWGTGAWGEYAWGEGPADPPPVSAQVGTVAPGSTKDISGVQANGAVGTFGVVHTNSLLSVLALGYAGNVSDYFWTTIDTDQTPNWIDINNS
jgi:hypothetical protein